MEISNEVKAVLFRLLSVPCSTAPDTIPPLPGQWCLRPYIKRLQKLEEIANTTPGVASSFAIQAGREIRIMAKPDEVSDDAIAFLAREISKKIESELEYPGQIKVNVIRETSATEYAN